MEFEELAAARAEIVGFVQAHQASVEKFYDNNAENYAITAGSKRPVGKRKRTVEGLTSTFTSLESLLEMGATTPKVAIPASARLEAYSLRALNAPRADWRSDNSGWAFCRLRSLGAIARHQPHLLTNDNITALLQPVWDEAEQNERGAYGIRELSDDPEETPVEQEEGDPDTLPSGSASAPAAEKRYTPNAYLTYWALFVGNRLPEGDAKAEFLRHDEPIRDWLYASLAEQIAFQGNGSPHSDPQQLAWSIAGIVRTANATDLVTNARLFDVVQEGLRAFFAQQHPRGDWDRGKALFNYAQAGTAYCYGYETLAELIAVATDAETAVAPSFRKMLRPFADNLIRAFRYARDIAQPLNSDPYEYGWGSGHQANRPQPESWATASVFRFMQRLRLLVGRWTNDEAQALLGARQAREVADLKERGGSWNLGFGAAGAQLSCYFALPLLERRQVSTVTIPDPESRLMKGDQGRSAMLFGPPGTGKTTMVEGVAKMLGWPFVEVTPAQFLDKGLDLVSARADQIFRQMMELDRCVILLDEIDELVKNRTEDAEGWERFFTTTMLPRLARLWEMGKILFFANTNDISSIDSAIRRSQRFDAAILVLPPGEQTKAKWMEDDGAPLDNSVTSKLHTLLDTELTSEDQKIEGTELVWYPLARFDQKDQLLSHSKAELGKGGSSALDSLHLAEALKPIGRGLARQDWTNSVKETDPLDKQATSVARSLLILRNAQRRGGLKMHVTLPGEGTLMDSTKSPASVDGAHIWIVNEQPDDPEAWALTNGLVLHPDGSLSPA